MALIGRHNVKNATLSWPNPFKLKDSDAKDSLEEYPIEIITLAMIEIILQENSIERKDILKYLQDNGLAGSFTWANTKNDTFFWNDIRHNRFDTFYKTYTPESLKERIEEVRPLIPYYKPRNR